jgi:Domain of unknown function (DUF4190)
MPANGWSQSSAARRTNPSAVAALVCGILTICGLFPAVIAALILGHRALRQIRRTGEAGYGLAKAGLILGYLGLALMAVAVLVALMGDHAVPGGPAAP